MENTSFARVILDMGKLAGELESELAMVKYKLECELADHKRTADSKNAVFESLKSANDTIQSLKQERANYEQANAKLRESIKGYKKRAR